MAVKTRDRSIEWFLAFLTLGTLVGVVVLAATGTPGILLAAGSLWVFLGIPCLWTLISNKRHGRVSYRYKGPWEDFYGEHHRAERLKYEETIRLYGGQCMERICVMPSRRIAPGAPWHLGHDHERGGARDYLGPTHPECNEAEAQARRGDLGGSARRLKDNPWGF